jgi:4a-hydroxytetrahydrobiopterin dehydratase
MKNIARQWNQTGLTKVFIRSSRLLDRSDDMAGLADQKCIPCSLGTPPLTGDELDSYRKQISDEWKLVERHHLERKFSFKNFREALNFTNEVGELAEAEGHHPDIALSWGKVVLTLFTHKIDGLSDADFVFAAKIDRLLNS